MTGSVLQQVLSIGETVEEVSDSGFLPSAPTLRTQLLADDSMLQVCHSLLAVLSYLSQLSKEMMQIARHHRLHMRLRAFSRFVLVSRFA